MAKKPVIHQYEPPREPRRTNMRNETKLIMWHCSAHPEGRQGGPDEIWDIHVENNGWWDIGYHFVIDHDGLIWSCRPVDNIGAGEPAVNKTAVHVCYFGGMNKSYTKPKDTRDPDQKQSMYRLTEWLLEKYNLDWDDVVGHNEYAAKACPSFDVQKDIADWVHSAKPDPEPTMPGEALGLKLAELEKRIARLEHHNDTWG